MVALRSRRLESTFGAALEDLTAVHIHGLVDNAVQEAFDLDFKREMYGTSSEQKRSLATDVAALANMAGGVILVGIEEDDQARAAAAPGIVLGDNLVQRIHQIIASQVAPHPLLDVIMVHDDASSTGASVRGFLLIAVPRSPASPHAVVQEKTLRYPRRDGTTTRYLLEPEVATAYRDRLAGLRSQTARAGEIELEAISRLDTTELPWVVVSLVPDLPGGMALSREAFQAFQNEIMQGQWMVVDYGLRPRRARVGSRRLLADGTSTGNSSKAKWMSLELHTDGCGIFAVQVADLAERRALGVEPEERWGGDNPKPQMVLDEHIVLGTLSGLVRLAQHARDRAAAGGNALVRAQLFPVSPERPTIIGCTRPYTQSRSQLAITDAPPPAEAVAPLDDLTSVGPDLMVVTAMLADGLGHGYGVPEMGQISRDGRLRRRYWCQDHQGKIVALAKRHGVEVTDDTI